MFGTCLEKEDRLVDQVGWENAIRLTTAGVLTGLGVVLATGLHRGYEGDRPQTSNNPRLPPARLQPATGQLTEDKLDWSL